MELSFRSVVFIPLLLSLLGCSQDDEPSPEVTLYYDRGTLYLPGASFNLNAIATDDFGLKSISLENDQLGIDQTYDLEFEELTVYEFDFTYVFGSEILPGLYELDIQVTNLKDKKIRKTVLIDFAKLPEFLEFNTQYAAKRGQTVVLQGGLSDDQGLTALQLICLDLDLNITYEIEGAPIRYNVTESFEMPVWPETGVYIATFRAFNQRGLVNTIDEAYIEVLPN